jgi:copper chaperone
MPAAISPTMIAATTQSTTMQNGGHQRVLATNWLRYPVRGMTCSHCVLSVREEVSEVPGVASVDVDLDSGRLTVTGEDVSDDAVRDAVADAGYEVAA